jgi:hypothetical protein
MDGAVVEEVVVEYVPESAEASTYSWAKTVPRLIRPKPNIVFKFIF